MESLWSRPTEKVSFPKIWSEFTEKESKNSERLVKYRIQDLPDDRFDDAIQHLMEYFLLDAPRSKFFGAASNKAYVEDYLRPCRWRFPQKTSLVCFREGSDDIVGLNVNGVAVENDPFGEKVVNATQTDEYRQHMAISSILYKHVESPFEKYGIDKYLSCMCLSVTTEYRGLNIGQRLLEAQRPLCKALDIHVIQAIFSSDSSNHIADRVGFKVESQYTMDQLNQIYPAIPFNKFETKKFSVKSLII
ncbi:uncharacterized protein LOC119076713 [Bradysia coprophila]|uniref:uncharacterized protein LOC119076713 n=1 Tax=Bradysia coprophila TaxID=38358 RepID=UPI00187DC578|nr:uncharacterized protein LOC119076713 [Bradysia coprophila]